MEERCNACRVYGGTEPECVDLSAYEKHTRPCPRVVLDADNKPSSAIFASAGIKPAGLFNAWLPLYLDELGLAPALRLRIVERAIATMSHPVVVEYQDRERERARAAASSRH